MAAPPATRIMKCPTCSNPYEGLGCPTCDGEGAAPRPLEPGSRLAGGYTTEELFGEDAASARYVVRSGERLYLARVLTAPWCAKPEVRETIREAALLQGRIQAPNVRRVRDVLETPRGDLAIITDYIDAPSAASYLDVRGPLDEVHAVEAIQQVLGALTACHRRGLSHLGLRPDCVLLDTDEDDKLRVLVDEFGLGRVLPVDEAHWAPEQHRGAETDPRTDVYASGLLLYELLTGELPTSDPVDVRTLLPTVSLRVEQTLRRALSRHADERFASVAEMAAALGRNSLLLPAVASPNASERPQDVGWSSHGVLLGVAVLLALFGGTYAIWRLAGDEATVSLVDSVHTLVGRPAHTPDLAKTEQPVLRDIPVSDPQHPLPIDALLGVEGDHALVDVVLTTDFRCPLASPYGFSFVPALRSRYGENVRVGYLYVGAEDDEIARDRARAALAADLLGYFQPFFSTLARAAHVHERAGFADLVAELEHDPLTFTDTFASPLVDNLLDYHGQLAAALGAPRPGQVFINGRSLRLGRDLPQVATANTVTDAIDGELDAIQALLVDGVAPELVAQRRAGANLTADARAATKSFPGVVDAPRWRNDIEGVPALGPARAPLAIVLYADLSTPNGRLLLRRLRTFYEAHADTVRLAVKLAPSMSHQRGFDAAVSLLSAHAAGRFWNVVDALDAGLPLPPPLGTSATELFRRRIVAQSREAIGIAPGLPHAVLANGRLLDADRLEIQLEEEHTAIDLLLNGGLEAEDVRPFIEATLRPLPGVQPLEQRTFLLANWQTLPSLGPEQARTRVFWHFSLLDPAWAKTYAAMLRLREEFPETVAISLVPSLMREDDPTLRWFATVWEKDEAAVSDTLALLVRLRASLRLGSTGELPADALVLRYLESQAADARQGELVVPPSVRAHAAQWATAQMEPGAVVVAWAKGFRFVGFVVPGGLAYEPYWDVVRSAERAPR